MWYCPSWMSDSCRASCSTRRFLVQRDVSWNLVMRVSNKTESMVDPIFVDCGVLTEGVYSRWQVQVAVSSIHYMYKQRRGPPMNLVTSDQMYKQTYSGRLFWHSGEHSQSMKSPGVEPLPKNHKVMILTNNPCKVPPLHPCDASDQV